MIEKCHLTKGYTVAMDNLFTTLPLLDKLTDMGMYGVGTIRENRLQGASLKKKAAFQKETRGTFDYTSDGNNLLVAWRDNKVVIVATNYLLLNPVSSTKRWSKAEKKHVDVSMPNPFKEYNADMGGVDLFDQFVVAFFFAWSINATAVNAWRLFRKIHGNSIPLLKFLRELALETLGKYGRNRPAQSFNTSGITGTSIKLDTLNHMVVKGESKYCRCQQCGRRAIFKCEKCNVSLHPECMKLYHQ